MRKHIIITSMIFPEVFRFNCDKVRNDLSKFQVKHKNFTSHLDEINEINGRSKVMKNLNKIKLKVNNE